MSLTASTYPNVVITRFEEASISRPEPGLTRRILAYNDKLFVAEHRMEKGWKGVPHSHPHEQAAYVVSGRLSVTCGGRTFEIKTGDTFLVRGGVEHSATALEEAVVVDVFTPCREDYIPS